MGSKEKLSLKWNSFEENISNAFRELREGGDFCGVTLACEDKQVEAHKVVLAANSPFFQSILKRNKHEHPLIYLKGVKYDDLVSIIDFIYKGEVSIAEEELNYFLAVAEDLEVKGLTDRNRNKEPGSTSNLHSEPAWPNTTRTNESILPPRLPDLDPQVLPKPLILKSEQQSELVRSLLAFSYSTLNSQQIFTQPMSQVGGVDQGGFGMDGTLGGAKMNEVDNKNRVVKQVIEDAKRSKQKIVHESSSKCIANGGGRVFSCEYCDKIYTSKKPYITHLGKYKM